MKVLVDDIHKLFASYTKKRHRRIEQLPRSGSDRIYFRIFHDDKSFIATYNLNVKENKTFIAFSNHFKKKIYLYLKYFYKR